jgi:hypothetical protein
MRGKVERHHGHMERADERLLIYYCNTLTRELDPATNRSTIIEQFVENQPPKA